MTTIDELTKREQPALALVPFDPISTLRFVGRDEPTVDLPLHQRLFTIGSGQCDIMVPPAVSTAISKLHVSLERVGNALLVRDLGSTNGTFSSLAGPRRETFQVQPGDTSTQGCGRRRRRWASRTRRCRITWRGSASRR